MALFGRDYDRDYGRDFEPGVNLSGRWRNRPPGYRGADRADTWSGADDRAYYGSMRGYVGGGYDRGYADLGYDRGIRADRPRHGYDRGAERPYKSRWQTDYGDPFGDRQAHTPMRVIRGGFDEQWEREHGEGRGGWFGRDREHGREGEDREGWRGWFGRDRDRENRGAWSGAGRNRYGRDYSSNPMGYDPYQSREDSMERGWGMRDLDRGRYGRDFRNEWY